MGRHGLEGHGNGPRGDVQVADRGGRRVRAGLDDGAPVRAREDDLVLVAAEDQVHAAAPRERVVGGEGLVRERDDALAAARAELARERSRRREAVRDLEAPERVAAEDARLRRQQTQQTHAAAEDRRRRLEAGHGPRHVAVEHGALELAAAPRERGEADVGLVVAEAREVDADEVEHADHAPAAVEAAEHGRRHEVARERRDGMRPRRADAVQERLQPRQVVELVDVVDGDDGQRRRIGAGRGAPSQRCAMEVMSCCLMSRCDVSQHLYVLPTTTTMPNHRRSWPQGTSSIGF